MTIETDTNASVQDFADTAAAKAKTVADDVADATGIDKSLLTRAQEAIEQAVETTVVAVKENPVAAAAIVGGVAAVAAGAAYGISKLTASTDATPGKDSKSDKNGKAGK